MGQLIQKDHPLFKEFPTESHTNWQWWPMANQRAVILPDTVKMCIRDSGRSSCFTGKEAVDLGLR